jgi:hypothetical protein
MHSSNGLSSLPARHWSWYVLHELCGGPQSDRLTTNRASYTDILHVPENEIKSPLNVIYEYLGKIHMQEQKIKRTD